MNKTTEKPAAYQNVECGNCGDPIEPGVWCGNDDCYMGNHEWETNLNSEEDETETEST